jgi:hypothetical protein
MYPLDEEGAELIPETDQLNEPDWGERHVFLACFPFFV